jgi:MoaA/NifB/PqqE/SkfB family radical SAM enzyme
MISDSLQRGLRYLRDFALLNLNYYRGREYIPDTFHSLSVQTSGVCNLRCRFCAYTKKRSERVCMPNDLFADCVEQALALGVRRFHLTPPSGEVFMDRGFHEKLEFLESHPDVSRFAFFTNFTIPTREQIERLARLSKLETLTISVYGHDLESFVNITRSREKVYRRLIGNLETLLELLDTARCRVSIGMRTYRSRRGRAMSDLLGILERFRAAGVPMHFSRRYSNWGGLVKRSDVEGLDMQIIPPDAAYRKGACWQVFSGILIMPTGVVNACGCRDVDATLSIGDLRKTTLREILSPENKAYIDLIREQQRGHFRTICRNCDLYRSVYRKRSGHRQSGQRLLTLDQFMEKLAARHDRSASHGRTRSKGSVLETGSAYREVA